MTKATKSYEDGIIAGQLKAVEAMGVIHKDRLDSHSTRLRALERIVWGLLGIVMFLQVFPHLKDFIG